MCRCVCGAVRDVNTHHIASGKSRRCAQCGYQSVRVVDEKTMPGRRFGSWTVVGEREVVRGAGHYRCRCDCGTELLVDQSSLLRGRAKHCLKCKNRSLRKYVVPTHGRPEYQTWRAMIARCHHPKTASYPNYGGRGIRVCDEWRKRDGSGFAAFIEHLGPRPDGADSIDRIDVNGHYEPGNVRWSTWKEQARNKRTNRLYTMGGVTLCVTDWAERFGVPYSMVFQRLKKGWPISRALMTPPRNNGLRKKAA